MKAKKSTRPVNTALKQNGKQKKTLAKEKNKSASPESTSSMNGSAFS